MSIKVMFDVDTQRLGDVIDIKRGISWDQTMEREMSHPDTYPVLRISNIQEDLELTDITYLTGISSQQAEKFVVTKGWTILVGSNGNPNRIGNPVYIDEDKGFLFASFLVAVAPKQGANIIPKYLYHFLKAPFVQQAITDSVQGTTGLKNLNYRSFFNLTLPKYDEKEQQRIVEILDTMDEVIQQTEASIAKLKLMKQGLLHDLLTNGLDQHGQLRDPLVYPEQFKESAAGRIPQEWEVNTLKDVGTWLSGGTPNKGISSYWKGVIPWVSPKDMKCFYLEDAIDHISPAGAEAGTRIVPPATIFIVVRGMILAHTFPVSLSTREMAFNQDIKGIICNDDVSPVFLAYWLITNSSTLLGLVTESTHGTKRFDLDDLFRVSFAKPSRGEQDQITTILTVHDARILAEEEYRDKLKLQKEGLMHDLLTGRVNVAETMV